jgi:hypothetical protein
VNTKKLIATVIAGALAISACDLNVPDLNNPGIGELENNPTPGLIANAATGLLIGDRTGHGAANGYIAQMGVVGREAYIFDPSDPRSITELLERVLNPGSPYGGAFWGPPYANIQLSQIVIRACDTITTCEAADKANGCTGLSTAEKAAIRGFARTIAAVSLLRVVVTRDTNGVVIDTDRSIADGLAPLVDPDEALANVAQRLDDALPDLMAGGEAFPFLLEAGFSGFDTPPTFIKFNRAIRARVAVYQQKYGDALTALRASFIVDDPAKPIDFNLGVYYTFTTKGGDVALGLATRNIYVHPSVSTEAKAGDKRLAAKVAAAVQPGAARGLASNQAFLLYPNPTTPVSLIRNEELLLLKAEALYKQGMQAEALAELNLVRTLSGGLPQLAAPANETAFEDALLYERRYSLLFEGHRLIDMRRFGRTDQLPLDRTIHKRNIRWPIPTPECDARPDEERCTRSST